MWLNERRRGPGWSASSRPAGSAASSSSSFPNGAATATPVPGDSHREDASPGASSGARPSAPGGSGLGVSGSLAPASRPAGRASAAAGAAPQEPPPWTVLFARADGGGGGARPLKSAAGPPDPPAAAPRWSRPDCGQGAALLRLRRAEHPGAPNSSVSGGSWEDPFSGSVHIGLFFLFSFLFFHLATVT